MSTEFNPYSQWLKIPPSEQPPNYYRLLSVARFESDSKIIESSVSRLVAKLQDLSTGKNVEQAQRLLNDVAKARLCLTDPIRKSKYDQQLKKQLDPGKPDSGEPPATVRMVLPPELKAESSNPRSPISRAKNSPKTKKKPSKKSVAKPIIPVGLVMGLGVAAFAVSGLALSMALRPVDAPREPLVNLSESGDESKPAVVSSLKEETGETGTDGSQSSLSRQDAESATIPPVDSIPATTIENESDVTSTAERPQVPLATSEILSEPMPDLPPDVQNPPSVFFVGAMRPDQLKAFQSMVRDVVHIEGVVVSIGKSKSGKTRYFRFSEDWDETIRVAMLERDFSKEWMDANLQDYEGKKIHVNGIIKAQPKISQKVELSIRDVSEIEIVK